MTFTRAVTALVLCLFSWALPHASRGHDEGVDVVLTIDTSETMKRADPENRRTAACKLFLSLLDAGSRVALVGFDAAPKSRSPLTPLGVSREELVYRLGMMDTEGTRTDLFRAVSHAADILEASSRSRRAVVLITAGRMDTGEASLDREQSARLLEALVPDLEQRGIRICPVALTKKSDFAFLKRLAIGSGGFCEVAEEDTDLHVALTNLYNRLVEPDTIPVDRGEFYVDRSVRRLDVVVTKVEPGAPVLLTDPDRTSHSYAIHSKPFQWFSSEAFESITVTEPMPGPWRIRNGSETGSKVFVSTDLSLRTSLAENAIPVAAGRVIEVWVQQGAPLEGRIPLRTPDFRITGEREGEKGARSSLRFLDDGARGDRNAGDGVYSARLDPLEPGEHRLWIRAYGMTFEREREFAFIVSGRQVAQAAGVKYAGGQEEERPLEGESRHEAGEAATRKRAPPNRWAPALFRFAVINFVLLTAGLIGVLIRQGRLGFKAKSHDD